MRSGPSSPPRRRLILPVLLATLGALPAAAQAPAARPDPNRAPSLREDPADWWGEVHSWTRSEATRPRGRAAAAPAGPPPADGRPTLLTSATARANIRGAPSLEAPVVRVMPRNSRLTVFSEAPGGWLQVGQAEPVGWIHESVVRR